MKQSLLLVVAAVALTGCPTKEEALQKAEEKGELMAGKKARLAKGIGDALQEEGKGAGKSLLKGAAGVLKAGVQGATEAIAELPVTVEAPLAEAGVKAERAALHKVKSEDDPAAKSLPGIKVYLVLDKAYKGPTTLVALDAADKEVGRAVVDVDSEPTGQYFVYTFDALVDLTPVEKLTLR